MRRTNVFTKKIVTLFLLLVLAALFRFYHISEWARFGYDEARDALAEREIIVNHKFTLLGPETRIGRVTIYFGPLHYYLMAPALVISHFDPLGPYAWTAFLSVATVLVIYLFTGSLLAALFPAVFPLTVIYGRWAWNPNTIPLFAALSLGLFIKGRYFLAGLFLGLVGQLHYTAFLLAAVLVFLLSRNRRKTFLASIFPFTAGAILAWAPFWLFEVRHGFFNLRAFSSIQSSDLGTRTLGWYYFLWVPVAISFLLPALPKYLSAGLILISLAGTLYWVSGQRPAPAQNPRTIERVAEVIAAQERNAQLNFNLASLADGDARATTYRYFLSVRGVSPLGAAQYPVADHLYVVSLPDSGDILAAKTYEVASFRPRRVSRQWPVGPLLLSRLEYK